MHACGCDAQVALCLYVHFGSRVLLQLEVFLSLLVARLTDARSSQASELQEAALEVCCHLLSCHHQTHAADSTSNQMSSHSSHAKQALLHAEGAQAHLACCFGMMRRRGMCMTCVMSFCAYSAGSRAPLRS